MRKKVGREEVKQELLGEQSVALLQTLHLLTRDGDLNADARRKLKQVNHFVGFLRPAIEDIWERQRSPLIVDVASGNAYLGFILYEIFLKSGEKGKIVSVEKNRDLYARSRERAMALGYERMEFALDQIAEMDVKEHIHILTALHACDTATDEALAWAVQKQVDYVFLVPCCQAEVARLLQQEKSENVSALLYRYPHHRREFGAHLTNVMRALVLESFGYQVTVTELTSWEHTAKGELIIGKRVRAFNARAKADLMDLLNVFPIKPYLIRELYDQA